MRSRGGGANCDHHVRSNGYRLPVSFALCHVFYCMCYGTCYDLWSTIYDRSPNRSSWVMNTEYYHHSCTLSSVFPHHIKKSIQLISEIISGNLKWIIPNQKRIQDIPTPQFRCMFQTYFATWESFYLSHPYILHQSFTTVIARYFTSCSLPSHWS